MKKFDLFEKVIGELDDILTKLEFGNIEDHLIDIFSGSLDRRRNAHQNGQSSLDDRICKRSKERRFSCSSRKFMIFYNNILLANECDIIENQFGIFNSPVNR